MPIRTDPWPAGTPCWIDLAVPDVEAAREFYSAVLGWTYLDTGEGYGHYLICQRDDRGAAGLSALQNAGQPSAWTTYLASDDVDSTARKITANGGKLLAEPFDVPNAGRMCIGLDPQGAAFGVWQYAGSVGAEIYNEPGSLVWNEAAVADPDAAREFYAAVFGYSFQDIDGDDTAYTFHRGGDPLGSISGLDASPAGTPSHWLAYFMVGDADIAAAVAVERGATVTGGPFDTPYGRIAVITDPQGATFGIIGSQPTS
ncbi:MAG TPA: VOC family protein [Pseudonocardiaceae bacterium]|nr:VOC family protein [Pseudonocardiaceae bacterium]